jgi:UDP-3-O-acyl N-acetylglucosamine deacetylase
MIGTRRRQRTIARAATVEGVGFLTGADVRLRFLPASADAGITFVRADLPQRPHIAAHVSHVVPRERRTAIEAAGASVEMVEHVMAAVAGLLIDNCVIEIDAIEPPGCDGSSDPFTRALEAAGTVEQDALRERIVIDRPVTIAHGEAVISAEPATGDELILGYELDYGKAAPIPPQNFRTEITPNLFRNELSSSRTFLLAEEAQALRAAGIGKRTTEADILIFGPGGPIGNRLRYPDEPARHKVLDMLGDFALAGADLAGRVTASRSGHSLNAAFVRKLLEQAA